MYTACSLLYSGVSVRDVSVQEGLCLRGVSTRGSLLGKTPWTETPPEETWDQRQRPPRRNI